MKWSIVGLFATGVVASVSAFLLIVALQNRWEPEAPGGAPPPPGPEDEVTVLVAARDLDARTVLGSDGVVAHQLTAEKAPAAHYSDPVQIVGKILVAPLKRGQVFEPSSFAREGSGLRLSSALTHGERIVSVTLQDSMGIEPLLYPGSIVDVIASFRVKDDDGAQERPVSVTLLQGVMVLAVGGRTVVSDAPEPQGGILGGGGRPSVTLLVEPAEAEVLKLAMEEGSISLAMRNPMDADSARASGTSMAALAPVLEEIAARRRERQRAQERAEEERRAHERERQSFELEKLRRESEVAEMRIEAQKLEAARALAEAQTLAPERQWETTILRGGKAETRTFPVGASAGKGGN